MSRNVVARATAALNMASMELTHLLDIGEISDDSPLDRTVQAALINLYDAIDSIKTTSRRQAQLTERGPLVFPMRNRDMRCWKMSDGRKAETLLTDRQASRIASARTVMANPSLNRYRVMTASQYLEALQDAVITEHGPQKSSRGYERNKVVV